MPAHLILKWNLRSLLCVANVLKENILQALVRFDIHVKTTAVVSDNATNMVKAFSILGFKLKKIIVLKKATVKVVSVQK